MSLLLIASILLFLNAIAHIIAFLKLNREQSPNRWGVLAFVFIDAILGVMLFTGPDWAQYLAIIFPALGGIALMTQIMRGEPADWIDYSIIALDVLVVGVMAVVLFT